MSPRAPRSWLLLAVALLLVAGRAGADSEKRPAQDYGRPRDGDGAGAVVAWPFRVLLFPLYLVSEFVIRRPLGLLTRFVEKNDVVGQVADFFTFGEEKTVTIYPSALFDFGLLPSVGFNLTWKDFFAKPNTLSLHFGTWGPQWTAIKASDAYAFSRKEHVALSAAFVRRSDNPFYGLGPHAGSRDVRYGAQTFEAAPSYSRYLWRESTFTAAAGARGLDFYRGTCCGVSSLDDAIQRRVFAKPFGYGPAYYGGFQRANVTLDSRVARPAPGSGVRVEAYEETMFDLANHHDGTERSWIKYGGSAAIAWDLDGMQRVLAVRVDAGLSDPIRGKVPFTEQTTLGGDDLFPGFVEGRLVGRSAAVAQLQYTWPVWPYLDGVVSVGAGNVWGAHFDGFAVEDARLTGALGVRSNGERDSGFELTIGAGTDPLSEGFNVSSFRFVIGSHHGL